MGKHAQYRLVARYGAPMENMEEIEGQLIARIRKRKGAELLRKRTVWDMTSVWKVHMEGQTYIVVYDAATGSLKTALPRSEQ